MSGRSAKAARVPGRLSEGEAEAGVRLDQFGGVLNEQRAEHETHFGEHEGGECLAVFQDQFLAAFHRPGERPVVEQQALPFPVLFADQFVEIGSFSAGVHHDFSPWRGAPAFHNGEGAEKLEFLCRFWSAICHSVRDVFNVAQNDCGASLSGTLKKMPGASALQEHDCSVKWRGNHGVQLVSFAFARTRGHAPAECPV